jgi:hypothetical protein
MALKNDSIINKWATMKPILLKQACQITKKTGTVHHEKLIVIQPHEIF